MNEEDPERDARRRRRVGLEEEEGGGSLEEEGGGGGANAVEEEEGACRCAFERASEFIRRAQERPSTLIFTHRYTNEILNNSNIAECAVFQ